MGKIVGIVPGARLFGSDDPYEDYYFFVNNYMRRVTENGGTPIGLLSVDGKIVEDALPLCDAFLLCGGRRIWPYHFQVVEYAAKEQKPLLGICLGMQVIGTYWKVAEEAESRGWRGGLLELYERMKKERHMFTLPVEHHWDVPLTYGSIEQARHPVEIAPGTRLHALLGSARIRAVTLHHYRLNGAPARVKISARAEDGTIEGIEYGEKMLGVQFHPELEDTFDALFSFLMESD